MAPHFETDLELIEEHRRQGHSVHALVCSASLPACEANTERRLTVCATCVSRRLDGFGALSGLGGDLTTHPLLSLTSADWQVLDALPRSFESLTALEEFRFQGAFDAGMAVASTVISILRNPRPSVEEHAPLIQRLLLTGCAVYLSTRNWIERLRPDEAFVFNGRFVTCRAFFRACQAAGVTCTIHDRGAKVDMYALFRGHLPHDIAAAERRIRSAWAAAPVEEAREVGRRFYEDRARGIIYNWRSYTSSQDPSLLPSPWPADRTKIAVFLSSEDEYVAIGPEWRNPVYSSQWTGLFAILEELGADPGFHVYVRCHPNSAGVTDANFARLAALASRLPNVTVVEPESPVSTYRLLTSCDRVVSFGSTVGIEATFWRKPAVLAGASLFRRLDATYNPTNHEEVIRLLRAADLPPKALDAALMFGYDQSTFGVPFRHFEAEGVTGGRFRGRSLSPHPLLLRVLRRLERVQSLSRVRDRLRPTCRAVTLLTARRVLGGPRSWRSRS